MKRILCIGDSNTWGYDPRSYFGSQYPAEVRWTGLLEQSGWQVINCGMNGMTIPRTQDSPWMRELIQSRLPLSTVAVMLGSNDLLEGAAAETTAGRMERFLACVIESAPDARLILIAPPVMHRGEWVQSEMLIRESARLAGCYREFAGRMGIAFADAGNWNVELTCDGVHFSPKGHAAFARGLTDKLFDLIKNGETGENG